MYLLHKHARIAHLFSNFAPNFQGVVLLWNHFNG